MSNTAEPARFESVRLYNVAMTSADGPYLHDEDTGTGCAASIRPGDAELRAALPTLAPDLRTALEGVLRATSGGFDQPESESDMLADYLNAFQHRWPTAIRLIQVDGVGDVYRIRTERTPFPGERWVHEEYITRVGFKRHRLTSERFHEDGTVHRQDARFSDYRTVARAEFEAPRLDALVATCPNVVRTRPADVARMSMTRAKAQRATIAAPGRSQ